MTNKEIAEKWLDGYFLDARLNFQVILKTVITFLSPLSF